MHQISHLYWRVVYIYWAENPDPERLFFVKGMPPYGEKRTFHIHIVEPGSKHWREKILFRDFLRSRPENILKYEKLKRELAKTHTYDREEYTNAKTKFIQEILTKAENEIRHQNQKPNIIFLTGASGSGKTSILKALELSSSHSTIEFLHFDSIGVPSIEEMIQTYGTTSAWQKAMTYHWVKKLLTNYLDKEIIFFEGQVNLDFIISAFSGFNHHQYKIILVDCDDKVRHERLHQERNQPELVNDNMDNWSNYLRNQAIEKNVPILDTTLLTIYP
jgi:hypothetical protein